MLTFSYFWGKLHTKEVMNVSIGSNIKRLRTDAQLSQAELGKIAGVTDKAVSTWEADIKTPRMGAVEKMAAYFGVPKSAILDDGYQSQTAIPPGFESLPKMVKRPLVGSIACGEPITAEENIEDYVDVPEDANCDFCLRCKGDSMIDAGIHDGDLVYIHIQPEVENGQIAAVRIDGEATLKRVFWDEAAQTLTLLAENRSFSPLVFTGSVLETVHIEGKAVGYTHWF